MSRVKAIVSCGLAALGWPVFPAFSQTPDQGSAALEEELKYLHAESLVITASKVLEHKDQSISTITVITQDQIRALGAKNLTDVLYTVPGVSTTQSSFGAKEIAIRGIKTPFSEKVLILLNGHPLDHNLTNGGSTDLYDNIALDNVKRIEIVRGPGSALYGANAFLGMINIFTKTVEDQAGVQATATGGSFGTQQYNVYAASKINDVRVSANANVMLTEGINRKFEDSSQRSGLDEHKYDAHLDVEYHGVSFTGHFSQKNTGSFAGFFDNYLLTDSQRNYQDYFFILGYKHDFTDALQLDVKAYHDNFSFDNVIDVIPGLYMHTGIANTKSGAEAILSYQWFESNHLLFGIKGEKQNQFDAFHTSGPTPDVQNPYAPAFAHDKDRTLFSAYVEDIWDIFPSLRLSLGARYDRFSDFGNTFNPRVGFNWEFLEGYRVRFSYGTAFRAPTFGETGGTSQYLLGSTTLEPEKIRTYEVGLTANPISSLSAGVTLFHSHIDGIINLRPVTNQAGEEGAAYTNAGGAISEGVEFEAKYTYMEGSYLAANYTAQRATDYDTHRPLIDVPQHLGNLMWNQQFTPQLSLMTNLFVKGETRHLASNGAGDIPSYAIVNTTLRAKDLWKGLELSASLYNLLDHTYQDPAPTLAKGFPTPGRSVFLRASYSF